MMKLGLVKSEYMKSIELMLMRFFRYFPIRSTAMIYHNLQMGNNQGFIGKKKVILVSKRDPQ